MHRPFFDKRIGRRHFLKGFGVFAFIGVNFSLTKAVFAQGIEYLSDFGGLIRKAIAGKIYDVETAQAAIQKGQMIHPRGTGHSCMGKSIKENAFVFTPKEHDITFKDGIVTASAATTLFDIDMFLEELGYMIPVSPDHRTLSLGGVLSVGGGGVESCRYGALVDHVMSMDLLTKEGEVLKNITSENPLFNRVLCGLGEHGTILSASLRCIDRPPLTMMKYSILHDIDSYVDFVSGYIQAKEQDRPDVVYASWYQKKYGWLSQGRFVEDAQHIQESNAEFFKNALPVKDIRATRKEKTDMWVFEKPYKYYVWSDHFVALPYLKAQLGRALQLKSKFEAQGADVVIYSCVLKTNKIVSHFPHYSNQDYVVSVGLYANFLSDQQGEAKEAAKAQMRYSKDSQDQQQAKPYRYGWEWQDGFEV